MLTLPIIQQFCTAARGGGILLFFDCLTPNRQLSATNELHLFSRQRLFLNTDSKSNSAVFSLFYRIFPDLSSVFLIFPHFFLSGRIFSGNRGKPYTFFVQTVKIRTECLILS